MSHAPFFLSAYEKQWTHENASYLKLPRDKNITPISITSQDLYQNSMSSKGTSKLLGQQLFKNDILFKNYHFNDSKKPHI